MLLHLALIYGGLVFCAVTGVIQAAAAYNNLTGLLFFREKIWAYLFAILIAGFSLSIFFIWNYRYATGEIEGSQQAGFFFLSTIAALIFTLILSSVIKTQSLHDWPAGLTGIAFFKKTTWFSILRRKFANKTDD